MKKLHYSINISAPVKKVWHTMLDDKTYREWTTTFMPGSYYLGSWEKGSDMRFLATDENGLLGGMISKIAENKPYELISIEHLGQVIKGVDDTTSPEILKWAGAHENYTFKQVQDSTELLVDLDSDDAWAEMFDDMWPKALAKLKELAEK